ncbi:MAG: Uncharacterised protein [Flavobacteriaceae bacterium]|jgi:DNA-binding XRE family transcriptional regulator|nr:MAG: Uncharacterised protein [Flavobacteriaceae bacterium]|tara:strand:+ start:10789 stop:11130 length:342 start_codon:yes stop_codon:yes gene_type:complete
MKTLSLKQIKDQHLGVVGTDKRDEYETALAAEILAIELKRIRKKKNITQVRLGIISGVDRSQISKVENNKSSDVLVGTMAKLFKALGKQISFKITDIPSEITLQQETQKHTTA